MEIDGWLLGAPRVRVAETWYDLPQTKASALLIYLAYSGEWLSRDELLYVFYPDSAEVPARGSFRQLLTAVRKFPYSQGLESEDTRLRWHIETDIAAFKQAILQEKWPKALELYKGELLHSFQPHDLSEFDNWLTLERQTIHSLWRKASLTFATELAASERYSLAAEVLVPLYKADLLDEEVMRAYLESLYSSGQKGQALETFTTFKNTLRHELSSEPEPSTLELISLIQEDKPLNARGSVAIKTQAKETKPHHNLPIQVTEFVGRNTEKAKLAALLAESACRLLTIVAPGGMGKTRLAIEVAMTQLEHFDNVCFVSFAAVASADLIVYTLADALELSLFGSKSPKEQVLDYLKNKKMLLVLDNLEHLLSDLNLISEMLATASEIKILATSRERLSLQSEHLFDLYGLTVEGSHGSEALQLFAERAKHNRLEFVLEENLQAVTKICQLVGGMPLAIELAASWSRLLNPNEIAGELEGSLDLLSSQSHDLPERHHSMRNVFEVSWQRLLDEEQTALRKLSVFQGGFTREAAREVTEVDLSILMALVNKSFVWRDGSTGSPTTSGRFSQHPLILQYVQQKANNYPEEKKQVEEKHGRYYLQYIKERVPELRTQKAKETYETLEKELPNIRVAWNWMLREQRVEEIPHYTQALSELKQAVAALDESNTKHHAALGHAFIQQASHESFLDTKEKSLIEITERGLNLLEPLKDFPGILRGQILLGQFTLNQGDFAKAKDIFTAALSLAITLGRLTDIGMILHRLMVAESKLGSFSEVSVLMRARVQELRELGDLVALSFGLRVFGSYLVDNEQLEEGEKLLQESLAFARTINYPALETLADLARLAYKRRDMNETERFAKEVYDKASKIPEHFFKAESLAILGRVKLAQGHLREAEQLMVEGLRLPWDRYLPLYLSHTLVFLAELSLVKGQVEQGVSLLSFLSHYPAIEKRDRDEVLKLLETAKAQLSERDFTQAQEASKSLTLEGIVTGILERGLE
jgi:DNA-binding SARP family transcriptional activator/tetratricopeptide (TPR) repeat protein